MAGQQSYATAWEQLSSLFSSEYSVRSGGGANFNYLNATTQLPQQRSTQPPVSPFWLIDSGWSKSSFVILDYLAEKQPDQAPEKRGPADISVTADIRDKCLLLARQARDAFKDACTLGTSSEAEASYESARLNIEDLWQYAYLRDTPFRDLLAMLDAAIKRTALAEFTEPQRDVLRQTFADLAKWMIDESIVEDNIERFADHDIDTTGPLRASTGKRVKVTIEFLSEP